MSNRGGALDKHELVLHVAIIPNPSFYHFNIYGHYQLAICRQQFHFENVESISKQLDSQAFSQSLFAVYRLVSSLHMNTLGLCGLLFFEVAQRCFE